MYRMAATCVALSALVLAGAPAVHARTAEGAVRTPAVAAVTARAATGAALKPKLRKCHDARCTFTVRKPVTFKVSKRFGYTKLTVRRTGLRVKVSGKGPGISGFVTIGKGGLGILNGISVRIVKISRTRATVRLAPTG